MRIPFLIVCGIWLGTAVAAQGGVFTTTTYTGDSDSGVTTQYTYTQAIDDGSDQELLRRPKHKASLNAAWQATRAFSLNATVLTVSSWIDVSRSNSRPRRASSRTMLSIRKNDANRTPRVTGSTRCRLLPG